MISIRVFTEWAAPTCHATKSCALANASDIMAGLERVAQLADTENIGAVVMTIDMSFDPRFSVENSICDAKPAFSGIKDAVDLVNSYGIPVVGGTGNRSSNGISPPVCLSDVISVGNTGDGSGSVAQDVPTNDSNWASFMDFWAPGNLITTAWPPNTTLDVSGTSVASPHVAAAYAALRSKAPTSGIDYFTARLASSGVDVTKGVVTKRRIDVGEACQEMELVAFDGKIFLEGPFDTGTKLMDPGAAFTSAVPLTQPFSAPEYAGSDLELVGDDALPSLPADATDWVAVSLRTGTASGTEVARRPAILKNNGDIVDIRGGNVGFLGVTPGSYYVVVDHQNHVSVISSSPVNFASGTGTWDFTDAANKALGTDPMKNLGVSPALFGMYAGDANLDKRATALDFNRFLEGLAAGASGYLVVDFNMDGVLGVTDFNLYVTNEQAGAAGAVP
jgi:hypothetical protein